MDRRAHASSTRPFVGRERELDELLADVDEARAGRGGCVLVAGESGVGKTRLCAELSQRAEARDVHVLWGRTPESDGGAAHRAWLQIFRGLLRGGAVDDTSPDLTEIARTIPQLRNAATRSVVAHDPERVDPDQARFRFHDAAASLLEKAARVRPLVVVLDDIHDADPSSLQLLHFLARELHRAPLLFLATYREDVARIGDADVWIHGALARESRRLLLRGLDLPATAALIEQLVGVTSGPAVVAALHEATGGNPFYLEETVRLAQAEGRLASDDPRALVDLPVPDQIRAAVERRLSVLAPPARECLAMAATIGRSFGPHLLRSVCGPEDAARCLDAAVRAGLVESAGDAGYAFANPILHDTVYAIGGPTERAARHASLAAALRASGSVDPDLPFDLARHDVAACLPLSTAAEDLSRAIDSCRTAARAASARLAQGEAVAFLQRALALAERAPALPRARHAELWIELGRAHWDNADVNASAAAYHRALASARALDVRPEGALLFARAALGLGGRQQRAHVAFEADVVAALEESLARLGDASESLRAQLLARLAYGLYSVPDSHERRRRLCEEATALARASGDDETLVAVLNDTRWALWSPATTEARLRTTDELIAVATRTRDRERLIGEHAWRLVDSFELGDRSRAQAELETYASLAAELRLPWYDWYVHRFRAMFAIVEGRFEEAETLAGQALAAAQRVEHSDAALIYGVALLSVRMLQGRVDEIEPALQSFAAQYPRLAAWRYAYANVLAAQGRLDRAAVELDRLAASDFVDLPGDYMRLAAITYCGEVAHAVGDARSAALLYPMLLPFADRSIIVGYGIAGLGSAARPLALLAATLGQTDAAIGHAEAAIAGNERSGARPFAALARFDLACLLRERAGVGDLPRAAAELSAARRTADMLGMAGLLRRIGGLDASPASVSGGVILRREGDVWSVTRPGRSFRLKHVRGLEYLAQLLASPGRSFHAADLAGALRTEGDAGELLDAKSKAAYRRRIEALQERAAEAEATNDFETAARARAEIDSIASELAAAVGLGRRDRRASADSERVRIAVTKAIRVAEKRLAEHDAELARYLELTVRTGIFCEFTPAPGGMEIRVEG